MVVALQLQRCCMQLRRADSVNTEQWFQNLQSPSGQSLGRAAATFLLPCTAHLSRQGVRHKACKIPMRLATQLPSWFPAARHPCPLRIHVATTCCTLRIVRPSKRCATAGCTCDTHRAPELIWVVSFRVSAIAKLIDIASYHSYENFDGINLLCALSGA
jgi:hypothetical protein